jgi:hypothetical protein
MEGRVMVTTDSHTEIAINYFQFFTLGNILI